MTYLSFSGKVLLMVVLVVAFLTAEMRTMCKFTWKRGVFMESRLDSLV
jgi:hypothetical protein